MQEAQERKVWSLDGEDPLEKEMQPTSVFLSEKSHGQRRLVSYSSDIDELTVNKRNTLKNIQKVTKMKKMTK